VRAFLDSVLVIYLVEQNPVFGPRMEAWLKGNPCDILSSELVRMEALVLPVRLHDLKRATEFEAFFSTRVAEMVTITRPVFDRAVQIRAALKAIKTPDALHLAAAAESGSDVFVTNDPQLKQYTGIRVEVI
jgi:predicted nucleic acid-binding protein